ncbi:chemotaxis protein CheW [Trichloromonas sp.]|uniref:chemotaxis protein CheW n=1 Tax=Trichloromonas sp. TaxID=3069249 RepID=UPI003D81443B
MSLLALNRPDSSEAEGRQEIQFACIRLASEMYALDIMRIKEIIRPQKLTSVPRAPAFVDGMINLRGTVIPVVDLRKRFDLPATPIDRKTRIVICAISEKFVGLMVDEVTEVRRYLRHEVRPAPEFVKGKGAEFFMAVCQRESDLVMLIDLAKILSSDEIIDLKKISPQALGGGNG